MTTETNPIIQFFLGGQDLEMAAIRKLLLEKVSPKWIYDQQLGWGAKTSPYKRAIDKAIASKHQVCIIELEDDLQIQKQFPDQVIVIDHHKNLAGHDQRTSLEQIFQLLHCDPTEWTRDFQLIAANDRGHIRAMQSLNPHASQAEIIAIRKRDREAQGVTSEEEQAAPIAIKQRILLLNRKLTQISWPYLHTSPVADRMEKALGGPGYENLLIISPLEFNLFGQGKVILKCGEQFPESWWGGDLPQRGFWGIPLTKLPHDAEEKIIKIIRES